MANPFTVQPLGGLRSVQNIQNGMAGIAQNYRANQQEEKQKALMGQAQEVLGRGDPQEIAAFSLQNPDIGRQIQDSVKFKSDETRMNMMQGMQQIIAGGNPEQVLNQRAQFVESQGGDATQTRQEIERFRADPEGYVGQVESSYALMDPEGYTAYRKATNEGGMGEPTPAAIRVFEANAKAAGLEPGTPEYIRAAQIELGLQPRAGISAQERIAGDPSLSAQVAASSGREAGATESAKLDAQLSFKPAIAEAVKIAEASAKSRGESLSEVARAKASLPGLTEVVNKLITLSDVATYTLAGKAFDEVIKQLGFGATEGATARAKMESLVSNQILPLLRDTFGAQFTEREGESLRKTMLDIDASPDQKKEILNAFLEQKIRDIETKENNLNQQAPDGQPPQRIRLDANGNIIQ